MTVYDSLCPKFTLNSLLGMCSLLGTTIPDPNFGPRNFHIKSFVFPSHFAQNSWCSCVARVAANYVEIHKACLLIRF